LEVGCQIQLDEFQMRFKSIEFGLWQSEQDCVFDDLSGSHPLRAVAVDF
jgi:hypothetical protein